MIIRRKVVLRQYTLQRFDNPRTLVFFRQYIAMIQQDSENHDVVSKGYNSNSNSCAHEYARLLYTLSFSVYTKMSTSIDQLPVENAPEELVAEDRGKLLDHEALLATYRGHLSLFKE